MFDCAHYQQGKSAAKLHLVLDHDGYLPRYAVITEGKASEVKIARAWQFAAGTILVFDRGYVDYQWYQRLTDQRVFFVTRLRHDAHYQVLQELPVPKNRHILKDQIIALGSHSLPAKAHPSAASNCGWKIVKKCWCCSATT